MRRGALGLAVCAAWLGAGCETARPQIALEGVEDADYVQFAIAPGACAESPPSWEPTDAAALPWVSTRTEASSPSTEFPRLPAGEFCVHARASDEDCGWSLEASMFVSLPRDDDLVLTFVDGAGVPEAVCAAEECLCRGGRCMAPPPISRMALGDGFSIFVGTDAITGSSFWAGAGANDRWQLTEDGPTTGAVGRIGTGEHVGFPVDAIAAGRRHVCVLAAENTVLGKVGCWGDNLDGQALGANTRELVPDIRGSYNEFDIAGTELSLAVGAEHGCVSFDGEAESRLACWGADPLPLGGLAEGEAPPGWEVVANHRLYTRTIDARYEDMAAGAGFTCGRVGSTVDCWGSVQPVSETPTRFRDIAENGELVARGDRLCFGSQDEVQCFELGDGEAPPLATADLMRPDIPDGISPGPQTLAVSSAGVCRVQDGVLACGAGLATPIVDAAPVHRVALSETHGCVIAGPLELPYCWPLGDAAAAPGFPASEGGRATQTCVPPAGPRAP